MEGNWGKSQTSLFPPSGFQMHVLGSCSHCIPYNCTILNPPAAGIALAREKPCREENNPLSAHSCANPLPCSAGAPPALIPAEGNAHAWLKEPPGGHNQPLGPPIQHFCIGVWLLELQVWPGLDLGVGRAGWLPPVLWGPCGAGTLAGAVCAVVGPLVRVEGAVALLNEGKGRKGGGDSAVSAGRSRCSVVLLLIESSFSSLLILQKGLVGAGRVPLYQTG